MSKNKYVNLLLKYCTLLPTFVCLNTLSLFLDIFTVCITYQPPLVCVLSLLSQAKLYNRKATDEITALYFNTIPFQFSGYSMYHHVEHSKLPSVLPTQRIYIFCVNFRVKSDCMLSSG